jgi:hypothetical protein
LFSLDHLGLNDYQANETLTNRGKTRAAILPLQLVTAGKAPKMNRSLTLDGHWFGIRQRQFATA